MSSYKSIIWTPRTELTKANFQQMADNDADIQLAADNTDGYGGYVYTWKESIDTNINDDSAAASSTYVVHLDGNNANYHIVVHQANEVWKFGVNFGLIKIGTDLTMPTGTTIGTGTEGYNQSAIRIFKTKYEPTFSQSRIAEIWGNSAYGTASNANYGGFVSATTYNQLDFGIEGQFLHTFDTPGTYLISTVFRVSSGDVNTILLRMSETWQAQIFARCMGVIE